MNDAERAELIRQNPDYGVIVCRCEEVSRGEILDALRSPVCVPTLDGVKKRVRPGMGRCQGWLLLAAGHENYRGISRRSAHGGNEKLRSVADSFRKQKGRQRQCMITMLS